MLSRSLESVHKNSGITCSHGVPEWCHFVSEHQSTWCATSTSVCVCSPLHAPVIQLIWVLMNIFPSQPTRNSNTAHPKLKPSFILIFLWLSLLPTTPEARSQRVLSDPSLCPCSVNEWYQSFLERIKSSHAYFLLFILSVVPFLTSCVEHHPSPCTHLPLSSSPPGTSSHIDCAHDFGHCQGCP